MVATISLILHVAMMILPDQLQNVIDVDFHLFDEFHLEHDVVIDVFGPPLFFSRNSVYKLM